MKQLTFNRLPSANRQRFVDTVNDPQSPAVLVRGQSRRVNLLSYLVGFALLAAASPGLSTLSRYEQVPSVALHGRLPEAYTMVFGALGAFVGWMIVMWRLRTSIDAALLFPWGAVIAHRNRLTLYEPAEIKEVRLFHAVRGAPPGTGPLRELQARIDGTLYFWLRGQGVGQHAAFIDAQRGRYGAALAQGDRATLMALDPFIECRVTGVWELPPGREEPAGPTVPALTVKRLAPLAVCLVAGVALGAGFGATRPRPAPALWEQGARPTTATRDASPTPPSPGSRVPVATALGHFAESSASPEALRWMRATLAPGRTREGEPEVVEVGSEGPSREELDAVTASLEPLRRPRRTRGSALDPGEVFLHGSQSLAAGRAARQLNDAVGSALGHWPNYQRFLEFRGVSAAPGAPPSVTLREHLEPVERLTRIGDSREMCPVVALRFDITFRAGDVTLQHTLRVPPLDDAGLTFLVRDQSPTQQGCLEKQFDRAAMLAADAVTHLLVR